MTLKTSLISAVVGSALVLGVPAAFGKGQQVATSPDAFERAVLARELSSRQAPAAYPDAFERAVVAAQASVTSGDRSEALNRTYGLGAYAVPRDAFERAAAAGTRTGGISDRSFGLNKLHGLGAFTPVLDSHDRIAPAVEPTSTPVVGSGRDLDWPQLGVGFGIGILLALGLVLAMRMTRIRPLAH